MRKNYPKVHIIKPKGLLKPSSCTGKKSPQSQINQKSKKTEGIEIKVEKVPLLRFVIKTKSRSSLN